MRDYIEDTKEYIINDFDNPKESTKSFFNFLEKNKCLDCNPKEIILDIGAGGSSGTLYQHKERER